MKSPPDLAPIEYELVTDPSLPAAADWQFLDTSLKGHPAFEQGISATGLGGSWTPINPMDIGFDYPNGIMHGRWRRPRTSVLAIATIASPNASMASIQVDDDATERQRQVSFFFKKSYSSGVR